MGFIAMLLGLTQSQPVLADSDRMVILDVRTPEEYREGHVQKSLNVDFLDGSFRTEVSKLNKDATYKLYCRSGNRSGQATQLMKALGFKDVENIGSLHQAAKRLNRPID